MQKIPPFVFDLLRYIKGSPLHPQWLSDLYHKRTQRAVTEIEDSLIIDIGSGDRRYQDMAGRGNRLVQLDYPGTNQHYQNKPEVYADARCLPFSSICADVVLLLEVLEHVPNPEEAIAEIYRVLKPGGELFISVPFLYPIHDAPHDYQRYTIHGLRHLLTQNGFALAKEVHHGNSIVTSLQLINLSLLEIAHDIGRVSGVLGVIVGMILYIPCLAINLAASPLINISWNSAGCFGYFVIAKRG